MAGAVMLTSCEKAFEVENSGSLSGSQAAEIMNQDPSFLASYVNGLYSWMVQFNTSGQSNPHDDYGHLGCTHILDLMGQDIAINGTWNWGTYDIPHDYGMYTWVRPYLFWNFYFTLINKSNEVINFFGEEDPTNETSRGYLGQAYALRAMAYTYLIQIFQDPVEGTTPNATLRTSAPAVPIIYAVRDGKTAEEAVVDFTETAVDLGYMDPEAGKDTVYVDVNGENAEVVEKVEKTLSDTQRSIDNLIAAIEQGIITPSTKQRLETLEVTKRELEDKILIENMKRPLRTEDELWAWFRYMRNFDLTRLEERRQLIDVFVNTVFLYNDRFLLTLNFGYGSKTVLFTDIPCSDKVACGRPNLRIRPHTKAAK